MKFYLSSFKIGNEEQKYLERKNNSDAMDVSDLQRIGFTVDVLDLKKYLHNPEGLEEKLDQYDVIWVRGGNTFVLAQAMGLSGFDVIVKKYYKDNKNIFLTTKLLHLRSVIQLWQQKLNNFIVITQ